MPHGGGSNIAWSELGDLYELGWVTDREAHAVVRRAAERWLEMPRTPTPEFIVGWMATTTNEIAEGEARGGRTKDSALLGPHHPMAAKPDGHGG